MKRISSYASKLMDAVKSSTIPKNIAEPILTNFEIPPVTNSRVFITSVIDKMGEQYIDEKYPVEYFLSVSLPAPDDKYFQYYNNHQYEMLFLLFIYIWVLCIKMYIKHHFTYHNKPISLHIEDKNSTAHSKFINDTSISFVEIEPKVQRVRLQKVLLQYNYEKTIKKLSQIFVFILLFVFSKNVENAI